MGKHKKLIHLFRADPVASPVRSFSSSGSSISDDDSYTTTTSPSFPASITSSPSSRYSPPRSPWAHLPGLGSSSPGTTTTKGNNSKQGTGTGLIASLVKRDGGKVYSLAAAGDVLYTGTDSDTVRVWRDGRAAGGFRTGSGLVKAVVVSRDGRVFTGHQDGKVRVWRRRADADPAEACGQHHRVGTLPALGDYLRAASSFAVDVVNPSRYVVRRRRGAARLRHSDAVSCLSLDEAAGLLYSASWDRTFKAWGLDDSRCLESVAAHDDAVNTVAAAGFDGLVLTGSADGTVKVWRRRRQEDGTTRHVLDRVLLRKAEGAVTAIAVSPEARVAYVGDSDGLVTCWRWVVDSGEPIFGGVLPGYHRDNTAAVLCLAASGPVVVSGSADGTLCAWRRDGAEHFRLAVLSGHTGPVKCVAVAQEDEEEGDDDRRRFVVYSGSLDGSVKVWRLSDERATDSPSSSSSSSIPTSPSPPNNDPRTWEPLLPLPSPVQQRPWALHQQTPELKHVAAA